MSRLAVSLLGTPQVKIDGVDIHIRRRKALALLAYMAVSDQPQGRDTLAALFWPEHDPSSARAGLRRTLASLRKDLSEECLDADRETIRLGCEIWLDVTAFKEALHAWRTHRHPQDPCSECMPGLLEAVSLYSEDFLTGFSLPDCPSFDDWQFFESQGLRNELSTALEWLSVQLAGKGEFDDGIPYARRWVALDPLHEPAQRQLMSLYALAGQRAAALRQYAECRRVLIAELGVEPGEETQDLHRAILHDRLLPSTEEKVEAPPFVKNRPRHNLPVQPIPFVGREDILGEIKSRLDDPACRLLTLVGPGGSGKTRLALEAGMRQLENYEQGVWFVQLEPLERIEAIVPAIAEALGFSFYEGVEPKKQILNYLEQKSLLIIMDNFEHLLDGIHIVPDILKTAPKVKILATSRAQLNLLEESLFEVTGMAYPEHKASIEDINLYSAVLLFMQRACKVDALFDLTVENLETVIRICRLVEGMPLGILLATSWLRLLSLDEIVTEIEGGIDFLASEIQDIPDRQRSMRAVFDHSWRLLTEDEQDIFKNLSVFRGGFTRAAAQRVAGASLRKLMALVSKSLIQRDASGRFSTHRLLRQYGMEKLEDDSLEFEAVKNKHSAYFCTKLARWESDLKSARQVEALKEMDIEIENCRAAWEWAAYQKDVKSLNKGIESLVLFHRWRCRFIEGEEIFNYAVHQLAGTDSPEVLLTLVKIYSRYTLYCFDLLQVRKYKQLHSNIKQLLNNPTLSANDIHLEKAIFLWISIGVSWFSRSYQKAMDKSQDCLAMIRLAGDPWWTATLLNSMGIVGYLRGQYAKSIQWREESLSLFRTLGDPRGIVSCLIGLGHTYSDEGQFEKGEKLMREGVEISREIGDQASLTESLHGRAIVLTSYMGAFEEAQTLFRESVQIGTDLSFPVILPLGVVCLGYTKLFLGDYEGATKEFHKGLKLARDVNEPRLIAFAMLYLAMAAIVKESYDTANKLLSEIIATNIDAMPPIERSLAYTGMGILGCKLGEIFEAKTYLLKAIQSALRIGVFQVHVKVSPAIALLFMMEGRVEKAVELYSFLESKFPKIAKSKFEADVIGKSINAAGSNLPPEVVDAAKERGWKLDLETTARELLAELETQVKEESINA